MTEKRYYNIITTGDIKDELTGELFKGSAIGDRLNEQHETIQFKRKHILCLQSVIQTIDVEIQEKGMTKERFEEIKNYWYQKFKGDRE